jgi:hypothetical protein
VHDQRTFLGIMVGVPPICARIKWSGGRAAGSGPPGGAGTESDAGRFDGRGSACTTRGASTSSRVKQGARRVGKRACRSAWNDHVAESCNAYPTQCSTSTMAFPPATQKHSGKPHKIWRCTEVTPYGRLRRGCISPMIRKMSDFVRESEKNLSAGP